MHVNCECFQLNVFIQQIIFRHSVYETFSSLAAFNFHPQTDAAEQEIHDIYACRLFKQSTCTPCCNFISSTLSCSITANNSRHCHHGDDDIIVIALTVMSSPLCWVRGVSIRQENRFDVVSSRRENREWIANLFCSIHN